jgi:hypothetical protein
MTDRVGWCHNCGTLQLYRDAPWLKVSWYPVDAERVPCCVVCRDNETWELGIAPVPEAPVSCAAAQHVTWAPPVCETCANERD